MAAWQSPPKSAANAPRLWAKFNFRLRGLRTEHPGDPDDCRKLICDLIEKMMRIDGERIQNIREPFAEPLRHRRRAVPWRKLFLARGAHQFAQAGEGLTMCKIGLE